MAAGSPTNLATFSTSGSSCGDGVSFKISHIVSLTEIVLAAPPSGHVPNCLHPGDDLSVLSPTTGHYGLVTVLSVSSDLYGVTLTAPMPPEMMSGRDFFLTRVANYAQLTVRVVHVCTIPPLGLTHPLPFPFLFIIRFTSSYPSSWYPVLGPHAQKLARL
jgi:hypothetical protein